MLPTWATTIGTIGGWMFLAWFLRETYEHWRSSREPVVRQIAHPKPCPEGTSLLQDGEDV